MWNLFSPKKTSYDKTADLIRRASIATSGACCEAMEQNHFFLKPQFDPLMCETVAFFMSMSLNELMRVQKVATKEDYERLRFELLQAMGLLAGEKPDFRPYAAAAMTEPFDILTDGYYRGGLDDIGISPTELRAFAAKHELTDPATVAGFSLSVLSHLARVSAIVGVEQIGERHPSGERLAVSILGKILKENVNFFLTEVRRIL